VKHAIRITLLVCSCSYSDAEAAERSCPEWATISTQADGTPQSRPLQSKPRPTWLNSSNSVMVAAEESNIIYKDGNVAWVNEQNKTTKDIRDFEYVQTVVKQFPSPITENIKFVVRDEGKNVGVFFQCIGQGYWDYKVIFDPTTNQTVRRMLPSRG
jgi:hypothetical protein